MKDCETNLRGYLLTKNKSYLEKYTDALNGVDINMTVLKKKAADNQEQVINYNYLYNALKLKQSFMNHLAKAQAEGNINSNFKLGKRYMDYKLFIWHSFI